MSEQSRFSDIEAERIVIRLRNAMPDRFFSICVMHLSFLLDMNNESLEELLLSDNHESKKRTPFTRKRIVEKPLSGYKLSQDAVAQMYKLIEYMGQEKNIASEGIFRKTGNIIRQKCLREQLDKVDLNMGQYSVHDCANVLKGLLSDLDDPLLTSRHFQAYCHLAAITLNYKENEIESPSYGDLIKKKLTTAIQLLFLLLPRENSVVLECLLDLLHRVANVKENMMTSVALGMVFAPHLVFHRKMSAAELQSVTLSLSSVIAFMIDNAPLLFKIPRDFAIDVANFWKQMEDPNHECQHSTSANPLYFTPTNCPNKKKRSSSDEEINTVVSFCDHEMSQKMKQSVDTQVLVAELYANVTKMPDSAQKRKFMKQFNEANGLGSPKTKQHSRTKSVGDTIRRRLNGRRKKSQQDQNEVASDGTKPPVIRVLNLRSNVSQKDIVLNDPPQYKEQYLSPVVTPKAISSKVSKTDILPMPNLSPATPHRLLTKPIALVSPITKSLKKSSKYIQDVAMTPRSRAPLSLMLSPYNSDV